MNWFKRKWGFAAYLLLSSWALFRYLMAPDEFLHYKLFRAAARSAWALQTPYNSDFGSGIGMYFYSPSSALFFFGPFAALPEVLGAVFFMVGSVILATLGIAKTLKIIGLPREQSLWLLSAPLIMLSTVSQKLEVACTGIFLLGLCALLNKKSWLGWFLIAGVANWKLQALPAIAFILVQDFLPKPKRALLDRVRHSGMFGLMFALWLMVPLVRIPPVTLWDWTWQWLLSVENFSRTAFMNYDNGFIFLSGALGIQLTWSLVQGVSLAIAAGFLGLLLTLRLRGRLDSDSGFWLANLLGVTYTLFCSPLGQNNAWIWAVVPLIALLKLGPRWIFWAMGTVAAFAYSSLWPFNFRDVLLSIGFKPFVFLLGASWCGIAAFGRRRQRV